jgi:uncharacterized membrane protein YhaH (DUF805 family)
MLNLFFGFSGRLSRRFFLMWSVLVPLALVVPPAIAIASQAASTDTGLVEDLAASGLVWPFFMLVVLANYISVALFWKRIQDADETRFGGWNSAIMRWGYAILTLLNSIVVGLNLIALGKIEGSFAGIVLLAFWAMACWAKPHDGANSFGPDPRQGGGARGDFADEPVSAHLDAAMQRALSERNARPSAVLSPKLARAPLPSAGPAARQGFGKRG